MLSHFFTVDVEEHFQVSAFEGRVPRADWDRLESRVAGNVARLLDILAAAGARATFFVLGWIGERHPDVVRSIVAGGHEVASHGHDHRRVTEQTAQEFRASVRRSKHVLEDITGTPVVGFRAPSFSIVPGREWALDVLVEEGYRYDSSLFPVRRPGYGYAGGRREPHTLVRPGGELVEFPPATLRRLGWTMPAAGGAYLRIFPYSLVRAAFREADRRGVPATFYVHPWEVDPAQPRFAVSSTARFRHYTGLDRTARRVERLLGEFAFTSIASALGTRADGGRSDSTVERASLRPTPPRATHGPRRVLVLEEAVSFGGSIVSTANLIRALDPRRYTAVFCTAASKDLVRARLQEAAGSCPVVLARKPLDYTRLESLRVRLQRLGVPLRARPVVWVLHALRLFMNLPYMLRVGIAMLRYRIDLVQLNNGFGNDEGGLVAMWLRKPVVMFFRGYVAMSRIDRALLLSRCGAFVAVAEHVKSCAARDGVPAERIFVATPPAIPVPVSAEARTNTRQRYAIPLDVPLVGFFGRIVEWKGQLEFVRAAAIVACRVPDAWFMVVGDVSDGPRDYEEQVRAAVRGSHLEERVVFTGYVDDVDAHYRAVDVVAHASIIPEPSGRVIFEAMDHGIPVVASDRGGPREFIEDGVDGFIVDPTDAGAFAGRLVALVTDPERRKRMGERARAKIQEKYGKEQYAAAVMATYDTCFPDGGPPPSGVGLLPTDVPASCR